MTQELAICLYVKVFVGERVICSCLSLSWKSTVPQDLATCLYVKVFVSCFGEGDL